jgi:hypothetical protein
LPRSVTATVLPKLEHDEVFFVGSGPARSILVEALQGKDEFRQLLRRCGARTVPCVDGQIYYLLATATDGFIREFAQLIESYIPEIPV